MAQLFNAPVPAAGTTTYLPTGLGQKRKEYAVIQGNLTYGSGGTSVKVFLQTSLDDGITWRDVACLAFLVASANKASAVNSTPVAAAVLATDGTLADDTIVNGFMGIRWRIKVIVAGTYVASTLRVDVEVHDISGNN